MWPSANLKFQYKIWKRICWTNYFWYVLLHCTTSFAFYYKLHNSAIDWYYIMFLFSTSIQSAFLRESSSIWGFKGFGQGTICEITVLSLEFELGTIWSQSHKLLSYTPPHFLWCTVLYYASLHLEHACVQVFGLTCKGA